MKDIIEAVGESQKRIGSLTGDSEHLADIARRDIYLPPLYRYDCLKQKITSLLVSTQTKYGINDSNELHTDPVTLAKSVKETLLPLVGLRFVCQLGETSFESREHEITNKLGMIAIAAEWAHYPNEEHRLTAFEPRDLDHLSREIILVRGEVYKRESVAKKDVKSTGLQEASSQLWAIEQSFMQYDQALRPVPVIIS